MTANLFIPDGYSSLLNVQQTERAIMLIKDFFQTNLAFELNLARVTAPLFVEGGTGINDDLNGIEKPASFAVSGMDGARVEIVQSLAKWKRMMLADLGVERHAGIYADMNAIRPDDKIDNTHSIYVDQWDWEQVIAAEDRDLDYLKRIVRKIYDVIRRTEKYISYEYSMIESMLPEHIHFIHSEELEAMYPDATPNEREKRICKEHGAVFIIGIGGPLKNSEYHDGRAPDYDDWITPTVNGYKGLNGDIFVYNPVLDSAFELSSMGIRVSKDSLIQQLEIRKLTERKELFFHQRLLNGELPLSIGGGIGQSRLCMLYLKKAHIGEIQASIWPKAMREECRQHNVFLL
ncbi:aspartate--ammonia ligase [Candidatus Sumerlaeota bacterium]|nr:aspartate--ammonia ligase [Candidatus Sumerlaeota bacterium]